MAQKCEYCGKGPVAGKTYARRGKARKEGGAGRKITGVSRRRFMPNLQPARVLLNGRVQKVLICTKCIKAGRLLRAASTFPNHPASPTLSSRDVPRSGAFPTLSSRDVPRSGAFPFR